MPLFVIASKYNELRQELPVGYAQLARECHRQKIGDVAIVFIEADKSGRRTHNWGTLPCSLSFAEAGQSIAVNPGKLKRLHRPLFRYTLPSTPVIKGIWGQ